MDTSGELMRNLKRKQLLASLALPLGWTRGFWSLVRWGGRVAVLSLLGVGLLGSYPGVSSVEARQVGEEALRAAAGASASGTEAPAWIRKLESNVPDWMARIGVPGLNALVIEGGQIVWSVSFGVADRESMRPLTPDAVFRVESISKPVTAWGLLHLVDAGRLNLDDDVASLLSTWSPPPGTPPFTVRQLLSQTAGGGFSESV